MVGLQECLVARGWGQGGFRTGELETHFRQLAWFVQVKTNGEAMGGVSGEADGLEEVDIMAVFEQLQLQGWGYKNGCISGTVGLINTKFGHSIPEGVPYH